MREAGSRVLQILLHDGGWRRMTGGNAIEVEGLRFDYPGMRALDAVSFTVAHGSVTALGPALSEPVMSCSRYTPLSRSGWSCTAGGRVSKIDGESTCSHAPGCPLHELPQEYTDLYGLLIEGEE